MLGVGLKSGRGKGGGRGEGRSAAEGSPGPKQSRTLMTITHSEGIPSRRWAEGLANEYIYIYVRADGYSRTRGFALSNRFVGNTTYPRQQHNKNNKTIKQ